MGNCACYSLERAEAEYYTKTEGEVAAAWRNGRAGKQKHHHGHGPIPKYNATPLETHEIHMNGYICKNGKWQNDAGDWGLTAMGLPVRTLQDACEGSMTDEDAEHIKKGLRPLGFRKSFHGNKLRETYIPNHKEYQKKYGGKFRDYWRKMHECGVPGFPNPDVTNKDDPHGVKMGAYTPRSGATCQRIFDGLQVDAVINCHLQWRSTRTPSTRNAYERWLREVSRLWRYDHHELLWNLWGEDYFVLWEDPKEKKYFVKVKKGGVPLSEQYRVAPNRFPKRVKNVMAVIVWDYHTNPEMPDEKRNRLLEEVKDKVLRGEIQIPGKPNIQETDIIAYWCNINKSVESLEHFHFLINTEVEKGFEIPRADDSIPTNGDEGKSQEKLPKDAALECGPTQLRRLLGA